MTAPLYPPKRVSESLPVPYVTGRVEDRGWRTLNVNGNGRELPQYLHDQMIVNSFKAWRTNPMGRRLIEMLVNFILGSGLSVTSEDEGDMALIYQWWNDPYNDWPTKIVRRVRDLGIYGEWLHRPLVDKEGFVRIADVQPDVIAGVVSDPLDHGECDKVILKSLQSPTQGVLKEVAVDVIRRRLLVAGNTVNLAPDFTGELFYFGINRTTDSLRGVGELFTVLDYVDLYDDMLFSRAERIRMMNQFFWDISIDGMTENEIDKWLAQHTDLPPKAGGVFAHNAAIKAEAVVPDLKADDHTADAAVLKSHIVASSGWPGTWFDDPGTAGRAVGAEMAESALRNIVNLQSQVGVMLRKEIDYHIWSLAKAGTLGKAPEAVEYTLNFNKPSARDMGKIGPALKNLILGLKDAMGSRMLTQQEGRQIIVSAVNQLGVSDLPLSMELPPDLAGQPAEQPAESFVAPQLVPQARQTRRATLWGVGTN